MALFQVHSHSPPCFRFEFVTLLLLHAVRDIVLALGTLLTLALVCFSHSINEEQAEIYRLFLPVFHEQPQ